MINNTKPGFGTTAAAADRAEDLRGGKKLFLALLALILPAVMLMFTGTLRDSTIRALMLCATTVIPSLFPFVVANEFFTWSGAAETLGRPLSPVMRCLFGMSGACASAILTGLICGYPSGAACAFGLYLMGACTSDESERCAAIASNAGPAFVIGGIGGAMLGDVRLGVIIWCSTVTVSLAAGVILKLGAKLGGSKSDYIAAADRQPFSPAALIANSALIMLKICAFITVFAVAADAAGFLADMLGADEVIGALLRGIFELTSAADYAARCLPAREAAVAIAAIVGWSGLSVHMQTASLLPRGLSMRRYYTVKLLSAPASAALCAVLIKLLGI